MKTQVAVTVTTLLLSLAAPAMASDWELPGVNEVEPNAYGLGVNSDEYGRPHSYRLDDGERLPSTFQDDVERDAYGPGVHMDQFGRPVRDGR